MARPRKVIDVEQLRNCAAKQWTTEELAAHFRVSRDVLERRYAAEIKDARKNGTAKLRDLQWKRAAEGSDKMIIHMSEHYLDQTPKRIIEPPEFKTKEEAIEALERTLSQLKSETEKK